MVIIAHFAQIENGIVRQVIVVNNSDCGGGDFPESEPVGQAFISAIGLSGEWRQTSYNNGFRNTYAGVGFTFDATANNGEGAFYPPSVEEPPVE